jgi:phytanoyl-CoA hydroxylase
VINEHMMNQYDQDGYLIVRNLFSAAEVEKYINHFMNLRTTGSYPLDNSGVDTSKTDPLLNYPRMTHMQRWDQISLAWLIDDRMNQCLTQLLGKEPYAVQEMLYFKPPGSRGQALHQDQFYLKVQPGTCMGAWMALDPSDEENGCLRVVPGTHNLSILCTEKADTTFSFTDVAVPVPEEMDIVPLIMAPGDVVFFTGSLIHGSHPNTTHDRFRRALVGHYIMGEAEQVGAYYKPVLRMDGTAVELNTSEGGGPCGIWVTKAGEPEVKLQEAGDWQPERQGIKSS